MSPQVPPSVVLDTNVILDWLLFQDPSGVAIGQHIGQGRCHWLATPAMQHEFTAVLQRPALQPYLARLAQASGLDTQAGTGFESAWRAATVLAPAPPHPTWRCRDSDDQMFLDLAWHQRADALLTKDRDLLALRRRAAASGLRICTPSEWLA
jgi:putative PIN family toxin of toxin-antitoxin system